MATEIMPLAATAATSATVNIADAAGKTFLLTGAPIFSNAFIVAEFEHPAASNKWHEFAVIQAPATRMLNIPGPLTVRFKRPDFTGEMNLQIGLVQL